MKATFKNVLSFEFWQKFGKALMVVIAVMPAAGLMISIGKSLVMINPNFAPLVITGGVLEQIGWGVIVKDLEIVQLQGDHLAVPDEPAIGVVGKHMDEWIEEKIRGGQADNR